MWHWIDIWNAFHMVQCVSFANQPLHEVIHPESESGLLRIPPGPEGWWFGTPAISKLHLKMPRIQKWYIVVTYHTYICILSIHYLKWVVFWTYFFFHVPSHSEIFICGFSPNATSASGSLLNQIIHPKHWLNRGLYIYIYPHIYVFVHI